MASALGSGAIEQAFLGFERQAGMSLLASTRASSGRGVQALPHTGLRRAPDALAGPSGVLVQRRVVAEVATVGGVEGFLGAGRYWPGARLPVHVAAAGPAGRVIRGECHVTAL